jgi:hypothetical protein
MNADTAIIGVDAPAVKNSGRMTRLVRNQSIEVPTFARKYVAQEIWLKLMHSCSRSTWPISLNLEAAVPK